MFVFQLFNTIEIQSKTYANYRFRGQYRKRTKFEYFVFFLKPDSVSNVVRNVQFTISLAYSDDFYCFFVM